MRNQKKDFSMTKKTFTLLQIVRVRIQPRRPVTLEKREAKVSKVSIEDIGLKFCIAVTFSACVDGARVFIALWWCSCWN